MFGVGWLYTSRRYRWGRLWLTGVLLVLWALSTPLVGTWLAACMSVGFTPLTRFDPGQGPAALVVLGGGAHRYHSRDREIDVLTSHSSLRVLSRTRVSADERAVGRRHRRCRQRMVQQYFGGGPDARRAGQVGSACESDFDRRAIAVHARPRNLRP